MITLENISKQYGSKILFSHTDVSFHENQRTGLIGSNGSGKTTILRLLGGEEQLDSGTIHIPSNLSIGYLPQEVEVLDDQTPLEIVLEPFAHILNFEEKIQAVSESMHPDKMEKAMKEIDNLYDQMHFHDGYSLNSRAEAILCGLGVPKENWTQPVKLLSGGYRMRTVLGRLLLTAPDFLLLDEPTNHLDMDSLVWLERFLDHYKGGMLIVSHDRDFLNRITTYTSEISGETITTYKGNYDQFIKMKMEVQEAELSRARNLETKIEQTERFVERFKAKATKATQAQSRAKLLEKLRAELPATVQSEKKIHFSFPEPQVSGALPLQFTNVTAGYDDEEPIFSNLSLSVNRGDKIAIVGPNGAGKSTLLKLAIEMLYPKTGSVTLGHNTSVCYFGQHQLEQLDLSKTLYETVLSNSVRSDTTFVRSILGAFLFSGDSVDKKAGVLSGGEKARLVLATILANPGNLLLLDEPTNHLDINSIEMLADAMSKFTGTILFVSHDEFFISKIATRIIEIRPGKVRDFPGSLTDYRMYVETMFPTEKENSNPKSKTIHENGSTEKQKKILNHESRKKLTRRIEKLERDIVAREESLIKLREIIDNPENASNYELLHTTSTQISEEESVLSALMKDWENGQMDLEQSKD